MLKLYVPIHPLWSSAQTCNGWLRRKNSRITWRDEKREYCERKIEVEKAWAIKDKVEQQWLMKRYRNKDKYREQRIGGRVRGGTAVED